MNGFYARTACAEQVRHHETDASEKRSAARLLLNRTLKIATLQRALQNGSFFYKTLLIVSSAHSTQSLGPGVQQQLKRDAVRLLVQSESALRATVRVSDHLDRHRRRQFSTKSKCIAVTAD
jgi:hypothetical protein